QTAGEGYRKRSCSRPPTTITGSVTYLIEATRAEEIVDAGQCPYTGIPFMAFGTTIIPVIGRERQFKIVCDATALPLEPANPCLALGWIKRGPVCRRSVQRQPGISTPLRNPLQPQQAVDGRTSTRANRRFPGHGEPVCQESQERRRVGDRRIGSGA